MGETGEPVIRVGSVSDDVSQILKVARGNSTGLRVMFLWGFPFSINSVVEEKKTEESALGIDEPVVEESKGPDDLGGNSELQDSVWHDNLVAQRIYPLEISLDEIPSTVASRVISSIGRASRLQRES
eukprot:scaffold574201_cov138-Attheya_sp.AAC.1